MCENWNYTDAYTRIARNVFFFFIYRWMYSFYFFRLLLHLSRTVAGSQLLQYENVLGFIQADIEVHEPSSWHFFIRLTILLSADGYIELKAFI